MPDAYVIQISGRTAGIVARDSRDVSFNFFAASHMFNAMEGQTFADPAAAERAARYLAKHGSLPRRGDQRPSEPGMIEAYAGETDFHGDHASRTSLGAALLASAASAK